MRTLRRFFAILIGAVTVLGVVASFHPEVQNVYRALNTAQDYDTEPPVLPGDLAKPAVLVFTKTNGYRHGKAIEAGIPLFERIAGALGGSSFATENSAVFTPELLRGFSVVVFHNASGAPLSLPQREALRAWIEQGGGFVGVHAALDDSHRGWEWYQRELVGAKFIGHILGPQFQEAVLRVEQPDHPVMDGIAGEWRHTEEWYSFASSPRGQPGIEILATVDEGTYSPSMKLLWIDRDLSMGDHPVIWTRTVGEGRALLTALGHAAKTYATPEYQAILRNAVEWVSRSEPATEPEQ